MTRELEVYLWDRIPTVGSGCHIGDIETTRDVITQMVESGMIQNPKQAWATLKKWSGKRLYDYGVTLDLGWKTQGRTP